MELLVPAVQEGDQAYVTIMLVNYRAFHSISQVLDQVCKSYGDICNSGDRDGEGQEYFKTTISCLLLTWLEEYPDDFWQPPDFPCLTQLVEFAQVALPGSALERRSHVLLSKLEPSEPCETKTEDPAAVPSLELAHATSPAVAPAVPPVVLQSAPALVPSQDPEHGLREVQSPLLAFPPHLLAEQLTQKDVELFREVQPFHCLHAIWSQRAQMGEEQLAPTIRAAISQFDRVTNTVITTCLGNRSMQASDRARVLEHWIKVARECQDLRNMSSMHAILSALQSDSIQRLRQTWQDVSRDSSCQLQNLRKTSLNWDLPVQEGTSMDSTGEMQPKREQERPLCEWATVPHLWMLLSERICQSLAHSDTQEGRLMNYETALQDYRLIVSIQLFQLGWTNIHFRPMEQFEGWFGVVEQLSESERYHLSCEREPPVLSASNTLQTPDIPDVLQPGSSDPQEPIAGPSSSSSSPSRDQLLSGHNLSIGDATESLPGCVLDISKPDLEVSMDLVTKCPGGQEKQYGESTSLSCLEPAGVTSASNDTNSSSAHAPPRAPVSPQRPSGSQPLYNKQVDDRCIIRVSLHGASSTIYKSILLTCDDRTPAVICKALAKYHLEEEAPEDYGLVQIISKDRSLKFPDNANVFYGMDPSGNYDFLLIKRSSPLWIEVKKPAQPFRGRRRGSSCKGAFSKWWGCLLGSGSPPRT